MRKLGKGVAHGGTYTAHSVSMAAAEKCLEILDETDALERIADYGTRLRAGMHAVLGARGIPHSFVGHPSMSGLYFAQEPPRNYRDWKGSDYSFYDAMARVLHDELILCEPDSREPWFISAAHDDSCLADTLTAFEKAVDVTLNGAREVTERTYGAQQHSLNVRQPAHGPRARAVRCHRHRRRAQRPGGGLLSGARRAQGAGARAQCLHRRRGGQPPAVPGLHLLELLVRVQPAAARDHAHARAAALRPADHSLRRRLHDDARWRASGAVRQPRRAAPRNRASLEARRRGLRPFRARHDPPVQVHQAAADARAAGPDFVQAARHPRTAVPGRALPPPRRGAHVRHAALLDHEHRGFPRRILRKRDRQGAHGRQRDHRHGARAALAGHRLRAAASLHGRHRRYGRRLGLRARRHGGSDAGAGGLAPGERRDHPGRRPGGADPGAQRPQRRRGAGRLARRSTPGWCSPTWT